MISQSTNGWHRGSNQYLRRQIIFVLQTHFLPPATCTEWCYPLRSVCHCGHVIWCKLDSLPNWAVWGGNTAELPTCNIVVCLCVTQIPVFIPDIEHWSQCLWMPFSYEKSPQQWIPVTFAKEVVRIWCVPFPPKTDNEIVYKCPMLVPL